MTPFRRMMRLIVKKNLPKFLLKPPIQEPTSNSDIIVSFTSFPARINNVWQVVECMMRQKMRPHKILLWLSHEQFPSKESIPAVLYNMQNDIFEIRMVEGDIRSHKKYLYVCREYPNNPVQLIDDDIYYPTDFLQRNYNYFKKTDCVICNYGSIIQYEKDGTLTSYSKWKPSYKEYKDKDFFFGSGGGVLFLPSSLYQDLTNIDLAMSLCPLADDIWLNAMVRLSGKKIFKLKSGLYLPIEIGEGNSTLSSYNIGENKNDVQLKALNDYYYLKLGITVFGNRGVKESS
jgi:hypothetical protein